MIPNDNTRISNKTRLLRWKEKLREACLIRVERSRSELLWKIRFLGKCALEHKGYGDSAFDEIISDELVQIKQASQDDSLQSAYSDRQDMFWEYDRCDGISELDQEDYEQIMQAMDKVLHEDSADKKGEDDVFVEDVQRTTLLVEDAFVASLIDQLQLQRDQLSLFHEKICRR